MSDHQGMAEDTRERQVWALYYRKRLALLDGRLPLFWKRAVADLYNKTHLEGAGVVKPYRLSTKQPPEDI